MGVDTMARGLLMPSPRLRLMPGTVMVASMDTASQPMVDMAMADTMARGLLTLNLRLRLIPGTVMEDSTDMVSQPMADMAMASQLIGRPTPEKTLLAILNAEYST